MRFVQPRIEQHVHVQVLVSRVLGVFPLQFVHIVLVVLIHPPLAVIFKHVGGIALSAQMNQPVFRPLLVHV